MVALSKLLAPQVLTKVISQEAGATDWLLRMFGCQPGGPNEVNLGHGRHGTYHIFNDVKKVAKGTAPGAAANRRARNPTSAVPFVYPRMHDSVNVFAEDAHNIGRIDNPAVRDAAGAQQITRQTSYLGQLAANWRKAQILGMCRDALYEVPDDAGGNYFSLTAGTPSKQINFQMPAGNKTKLDMLGDGDILAASWATVSTKIGDHLLNINTAFERLIGGYLAAVIMPTAQWINILNNTQIQALSGTSNAPFETLSDEVLPNVPGTRGARLLKARLNFMPQTEFYVTDQGLDLGKEGSETFTPICASTNAIFIGAAPSSDVVQCYIGSEPIAEYDGGPETVRFGLNAWSTKSANPTSTNLFALDNALIVNHVPKSIAYGLVQY